MELLYLYIEDFRNFKNIGFNFSPAFSFQYNQPAREVAVKRNPDNRHGFFGEQIQNVNGIVGMNGSGKSNLLDLICYLTKSTITKWTSEYILLFRDTANNKDSYILRSNIPDVNCSLNNLEIIDASKPVPNLSVVFFSNIANSRQRTFSKDLINLSLNANAFDRTNKEVYNQVRFLFSDYANLITLESPGSLLISNSASWPRQIQYLKDAFPFYYQMSRQHYRPTRNTENPVDHFRYTFRFSILIFLLEQILRNGKTYIDRRNDSTKDYVETINELYEKAFENSNNSDLVDIHNRLEKLIEAIMRHLGHVANINKFQVGTLLDFDKVIDILNPTIHDDNFSQRIFFNFPLSAESRSIFKKFASIFDFTDIIDVEWAGLSSGHRAFLNLFSQLHSAIRRVSQHEHVLICIDEGDLYLHPAWQREFLNRLIRFVPHIFKKKLQFILTTHSPFLISDLPREHLILLKPDERGNSIVVTEEASIELTFGANIIDLYAGSFFLNKGTISEFSLNKIRKAINIALNSQSTPVELEEAYEIAVLIGDEIIREKLLKMLEDAKVK